MIVAIPGPDVAPVLVTIVLTAAVAVTVILRGPLGRALARRIEGSAPRSDGASDRIEQLEQRVAELEGAQLRISELEERLDFAERMLARTEPAERLHPGRAQ
jgi:hypothetical protein